MTMPAAGPPAASLACPGAPASALPDEVVRLYVNALNGKDASTAQHLLTAERAADVSGAADGWFTNVSSITDVHVRIPRPELLQGTAAEGYRHAMFVPVSFTLRQKHE